MIEKKLIEEYQIRYPNVDKQKLVESMELVGFSKYIKPNASMSSSEEQLNTDMKNKLHILLRGYPIFKQKTKTNVRY
jgi:hypothetical protein